jgi:AraC family transcriptional regulator, regulatory protein of adaptative response / DNA-3-methyladenine glycosylase II
MTATVIPLRAVEALTEDACQRAVSARDARFDGVFFVAITTTRVYCRPVCPARVTYPNRRRFFNSAAAAECAGYRPCLRCRPELAPGRALMDAVPRLAHAAAYRIGAGALNGAGVGDLARELGVSERHLRRALEREVGVSPVALAQTHRLLLAKRLLADSALSVTQIAYASGFQSLRRFNTVVREQYRMPPSALRRASGARGATPAAGSEDLLRLTLAYRAPLSWDLLLAELERDASQGIHLVTGRRYARTVRLEGRTGYIVAEDAAPATSVSAVRPAPARRAQNQLNVDVSPSLVPVLMPLLARLRNLFDLDAEPLAIDAHLAQGGLAALVRRRPGLRIAGAIDGFEAALHILLGGGSPGARSASTVARRVVAVLGEPFESGIPLLTRLAPTAERVAEAGARMLTTLGVSPRRADAVVAVARLVASGELQLNSGASVDATYRALTASAGVGDRAATMILIRALHWPDAFPASDRALQRAAGVPSAHELLKQADLWRPWRAYAAAHLWRCTEERCGALRDR